MKRTNRDTLLAKLIAWTIGAIFIVAPFYAPITVLLSGELHHFDLLRIWKEIALTGLGVLILYFLLTHIKQSSKLIHEKLVQVILGYALLLIGIAVFDVVTHRVAVPAVIYGLMIDLRLVGFFLVVYLAFKTKQLNQSFVWWKFLLIPAVIVVLFGLLQMTVLPKDVLTHIGYSKSTITPYQAVDNNPDFIRVQSTMRGPNPLGAYLILVISTVGAFIFAGYKKEYRKWLVILLLGSFVLLFGSYSRSAFMGAFLALATLLALQIKRPKWLTNKIAIFTCVVLASLSFVAVKMYRQNYVVDTVLLHSNSQSTSPESSNSQRGSALRLATKDVIQHPLGGGIGSAGPASLRNTNGPGKIAENYFLQVGQEAGWLGMGLFMVICFMIGKRLYGVRDTVLGAALFASLIGLSFVNLLSHAWSDDTLAYLWWGLAGIAVAHYRIPRGAILNKKRKHAQIKEKTA